MNNFKTLKKKKLRKQDYNNIRWLFTEIIRIFVSHSAILVCVDIFRKEIEEESPIPPAAYVYQKN